MSEYLGTGGCGRDLWVWAAAVIAAVVNSISGCAQTLEVFLEAGRRGFCR
jgi:hypothetical protein